MILKCLNEVNILIQKVWDLRWCKFLNDNWEEDNRAIFVDLEDSEDESGEDMIGKIVYSYFNVEDSVENTTVVII